MKKVKKWAALGLAAVMTLSLAACGGKSDDAGSGADNAQTNEAAAAPEEASRNDEAGQEAPADNAGGEKVKINMAVWNGTWGEDLNKFMADFNSKNPDIELDVQMQTGDYSDFLGAKVAANVLPDVYILTPYTQVQAFAEAGRLMDLSGESFVDRVYPAALDAGKGKDGKIYAYPANYEYLGVFYNKALFEQIGRASCRERV